MVSTARRSIGTSTRVRNAPLNVQNRTNLPDTLSWLSVSDSGARTSCSRTGGLIMVGSLCPGNQGRYNHCSGGSPAIGRIFPFSDGSHLTPLRLLDSHLSRLAVASENTQIGVTSWQHSPHRRGALLNLIAPTILSAPEPSAGSWCRLLSVLPKNTVTISALRRRHLSELRVRRLTEEELQ